MVILNFYFTGVFKNFGTILESKLILYQNKYCHMIFSINSTKIFQKFTTGKSSQKLPRFSYPFDFTNNPEKFQLYDSRFYQQPIIAKLYPKEILHIQYVLKGYNQLLNKGKVEDKKFIHPQIYHKTLQFREILKEYNIAAKFDFNLDQITQTQGFLQCYGVEVESRKSRFIQDYKLFRENERLNFQLKQQQNKQTELKKDVNEEESIVDTLKQNFKDNQKKVKNIEGISQMINNLMKIKKTKSNFDKFIHIQRVHSFMRSQYEWVDPETRKRQKLDFKNLIVTKWLYNVETLQPEDIRQSRKRILFDFQLWNRGFFIPNKQYI